MSQLRIVIDTNVFISALLNRFGWEAQLIELIAHRAFEFCVSTEVLAEYRGVLNRAKFSRIDPKRISRLLSVIDQEATVVTPAERLSISGDEEDNRFYECADAAHAAYIVTGNLRHFTKGYKTTKITTARQLLTLLSETGRLRDNRSTETS